MTLDNTDKTRTSRRGGFTLLEIMIVVAIFTALIAYVLIGLRQQMHLSTLKEYIQDLDMQGSRIMQELTFQLRPAILPVYTDPENDSDDRKAVFALLDSGTNGFRAPGGEGQAWLTALSTGSDRIAFVVPVDAQGDQDVFDDNNHMEVGQRRSSGISLDSGFSTGGTDFVLEPGTVACSLVRVSPDKLADDTVGGAENISGWPEALYSGTPDPNTSAFSVIRYVPARDGGALRLVNENAVGVDLNGDGLRNATFHIGKLQLVHVGGTHAVQPPTTGAPVYPAITSNVPPEIIDLSADVVLREVNPAIPAPMFRLVEYPSSGISDGGVAVPRTGGGSLALAVHVNLFNPTGNQVLQARAPHRQRDALNRQFGAVLTLRNMAR